jgi:rhamnulokinase
MTVSAVMTQRTFAAIDIGASGGRVVAGVVSSGAAVDLLTVHRFANDMREVDGHLRWDMEALKFGILDGLAVLARQHPEVESIGIDTWAIDYGLLDEAGTLLADPIAYRDARTDGVADTVHELVDPAEVYRINGLQFLPFTTLYQLHCERQTDSWAKVAHAVLIPDLIAYWLTGALATEVTNASTTGLLDVHTRSWSAELMGRLGLPHGLFPPLEGPGAVRGAIRADVAARVGLPSDVVVTTVGSHDTASAVAGVPFTTRHAAYVASGTWSLVGLELDAPVVTDASQRANFTNEAGLGGRTRFLHNVGGLWLLQESMRHWAAEGAGQDIDTLLAAAADLPADEALVDVDDVGFIAPGDMPDRIADAVIAAGGVCPDSPAAVTRCIVDSLAHGYATTIERATALADATVDTVHVVGGGAQNALLCQRTADLTGLPVIAGPVEATALGNVCAQASARGALPADLDSVRRLIAETCTLVSYRPAVGR